MCKAFLFPTFSLLMTKHFLPTDRYAWSSPSLLLTFIYAAKQIVTLFRMNA